MATTTITVNVAESQNYLATSRTISVNSSTKQDGYITLSTNSVAITGQSGATATVNITSNSGGALSVSSSDTSKVTASLNGTTITLTGLASGSATITVIVGETSTYTAASATISVTASIHQIQYGVYGVKWTTNVAKGTRTQDAANFVDPVPCLNGGSDGSGSSPFDYVWPWYGMKRVKVTCSDFNVGGMFNDDFFVQIPKFWYKISFNSSGYPNVEISSTQRSGYSVSPAHRNRDGEGERDYIYVTQSDQAYRRPLVDLRDYTYNDYGEYAFQEDYAVYVTLFLLFVVEMAYTEASSIMGIAGNYGTSVVWNYHTGTSESDRSSGGTLRYRNMWMLGTRSTPIDGLYFCNGKLYSIDNPKNYRSYNLTNGRLIGDAHPTNTSTQQFNGLKLAYTSTDDYLFEGNGYASTRNIFPHAIYKVVDSTGVTDYKYCFYHNNYSSYNTYGSMFNLSTGIGNQQSGSTAMGYINNRPIFVPPNNYSHIISIEEV